MVETLYNFYKIITLFDNDDAGVKAVQRYTETYKIHGCVLTMSKDISDAMKNHGFDKVHKMLKPLLKETLNKESLSIKDKATQVKITEVAKFLIELGKNDKVDNSNLVDLLQYYELVKEIRVSNGL